MAMNFGNFGSTTSTPATPSTGGILNLQKGGILDLTKVAPSLKRVMLGGGWDTNTTGGYDFDLDISAFLLDSRGKVDVNKAMERVVFFNNMIVPGIQLMGDNRTGTGEGDDEQIMIDLSQVSPEVQSIVFSVNIFEATQRRQTFGQVQNSFVRLVDLENNEKELCRFELKENAGTSTAVVFAKLFRNSNGGWSFEAIGETYIVADLNQLLQKFV